MLLGDVRQCIFSFKKATPFYLMDAESIFGQLFEGPWVQLCLYESFRCPRKVCNFVNHIMGESLMKPGTDKEGRVEYHVINTFSASMIGDKIVRLLSHLSPSDIFVLAPSLRSEKLPVRMLSNWLTERRIP